MPNSRSARLALGGKPVQLTDAAYTPQNQRHDRARQPAPVLTATGIPAQTTGSTQAEPPNDADKHRQYPAPVGVLLRVADHIGYRITECSDAPTRIEKCQTAGWRRCWRPAQRPAKWLRREITTS